MKASFRAAWLGGATFVTALAGCGGYESNPVVEPNQPDPAVDFEQLEVAPDFEFRTRRSVQLEIESTETQRVEVTDAEGRRLLVGGLSGGSVDMNLPLGFEPILNVRTGEGDAARIQTVNLVGDKAEARF